MTATALRLPRVRSPRPLALLVAALAIVAGSQVSSLLQPPAAPAPAIPAGAAPNVQGPAAPPEAPVANVPGSLAQIDHSIAAWTQNLALNDRDFLSAANLAALYEGRARLSGDVGDYSRAADASERSLAIQPGQLDVLALHARLAARCECADDQGPLSSDIRGPVLS